MQHHLINHPRLNVYRLTGTEGPRHDPYSYEEYHVENANGKTVLHCGLGVTLTNNGRKVEAPINLNWEARERYLRTTAFEAFAEYSIVQIERIHARLQARCRRCGSTQRQHMRGHPGEHFECCSACGHIMDTYFNKAEIE